MNRADVTAVRWAAAAVAFEAVLALCVLLVLPLMSSAAVPQAGMPLGFALGIAAVAGLLGGGGFAWGIRQRDQARRFVALCEEAGIRG